MKLFYSYLFRKSTGGGKITVNAELQPCALCLQMAKLCNSHVVSESLYADVYEDDHRYTMVSLDKDKKDRCAQKGARERLLCQSCEQLLCNEYEDHGTRMFRKIKAAIQEHETSFTVEVQSYRRFKLFQLAQLWRMGIAKGQYSPQVSLPPSMLEDLRMMLLYGDPRPADYYGVIMEAIIVDEQQRKPFEVIMTASPTIQLGDYHFVLATFAGFSWYYCAHRTVTDERLNRYFLQTKGSATIRVQMLKDAWHIQRFADQLEAAGKL